MSISQDEKGCEPDDENVLYSFPAFNSFDNSDGGGSNEILMPPLVLELIPLPLLSENFEQMPVGARGWYASAILSAMMMLSYNNIDWDDDLGIRSDSDEDNCANIKNLKVMNGIDLLREDLKRACAGSNRGTSNTSINMNNNIFLELGSGTVGLAGMTMAWIVAQHERDNKKLQDSSNSRFKVMLTDYDHDCLEQLERNAVGVRRTFREYFSMNGSNDDDGKDNVNSNSNGIIPDIDVVHLDWNEYDQDQSPIFPENANIDDDDIHYTNNISFACGAALVYTEDTAACVDQVAKILRLHPKSVVWVVQWPRGGWFNVFQQELLSRRYESKGLKIDVHKFGPSSSPDMFSAEVQQLAQKLMPATMQQECQMTIKDLRAIRIANITAE
jgi:hypothetical protein